MAEIDWAAAVSGDFGDAADWAGGVVPGPSDDAILALSGEYTVTVKNLEDESVNSLTVDDAGATVLCPGTLTIGSKLAVIAGAFNLQANGTIINEGTINAAGGTFVPGGTIEGGTIVGASGSWDGTLSGVTYEGTLTLSSEALYVSDGLKVTGANGTGPGVIDLTGNRTFLFITDTETLDNATLNIGSGPNGSALVVQPPLSNSNVVLTFGTNFKVVQVGEFALVNGDDFLVNEGTVTADTAGGEFGIGAATFSNTGMISAGGAGGTFGIDCRTLTNDGTIAVTNGDTLEIDTGPPNAVAQVTQSSSGMISLGAGSTLLMGVSTDGAQYFVQIDGGTLKSTGSGEVLVDGKLSVLGGAAATNDEANFAIPDDAVLTLEGSIANTGLIAVTAGADTTGLSISTAGAMLTGAGSVTLTGVHARIIGASAAATLTNGNTISGVGNLGQGRLTLINTAAGVIDGVGATAMVLDTAGETLINDGLIEDTGGAGLAIKNTTVNGGGGGTIASAGGPIRLQGADLAGGTLAGGPVIAGSGTNVLDGAASAVDNEAHVQIVNGQGLTIEGAIANSGEIALESGGTTTTLTVGAAGVTLTGGGQVFMDNETENLIVGASSAATLTNAGNVILGAGDIGDGEMALVNEAGGIIEAERAVPLTIDTGANAIVNAGLIEVTGTGGATIASAVDNTGVLKANLGTLTVDGAVSGTGRASIGNGTLSFASGFSQNVAFTGKSGELALADSQSYAGTISGFSTTGATSLDLEDIAYVSGTTTATYVGTTAGGVLTVTSGSEVANIAFTGNYAKSSWTLSAAPGGGTLVVDPTVSVTGRMAQAMAGLGARSAQASAATAHAAVPPSLLATPGTAHG